MAKIEFQIAPEKLHLFQREVNFLNRVYWAESIIAEYGERENDLINATLRVVFPRVGDYQVVGWLHHKGDLAAIPLHIEQARDMDEHLNSRKCDLLGKRQSRNETWVLVDDEGKMLCCGPAGALLHDVDRYKLDCITKWLRQLSGMINRRWGVSSLAAVPLADYLATVHASIREHGFIPKSMGNSDWLRYEGLQPTYFHAYEAVHSKPKSSPRDIEERVVIDVTDVDRAIATRVLDFVRDWTPAALNEFQTLLYKAASENVVQTGVEAAAAFAVVEYLQQQSTHFGEVNEMCEVDLIPIVRTGLKKSTLYKFLTMDGKLLTWFSNQFDESMRPGRYKVRVLEHEIYQGITQTRVEVTPYDRDRSQWKTDIRVRGEDDGNMDYVVTDKDGRVVFTNFWMSHGEGAINHLNKFVERSR